MSSPFFPWVGLHALQPQRCHHAAWFLYGCVERELVIQMRANTNWWMQAFVGASTVRRPLAPVHAPSLGAPEI
jgi:hypothetical protein